MDRQISENLGCFCNAEYMDQGDDAATNEYTTSDGKQVVTCAEYFDDKGQVVLLKMGVSIMIVLVNFVLRMILVDMIKGLRLRNLS